MTKGRVLWLDVAKGMAIILVVLGHSSLPAVLNRFIFAFHMPFFFFASGYVSVFNKYNLGDYVSRKAKVLLLPFLRYSIINLLLQPYVSDMTYQEYWMRFLQEGWLGVPLWFVPVLFLALLLAKIVFMIESHVIRRLMYIVLPIMSIVLKEIDLWLPWNISVVPYASFLIIIANWGGRLFNTPDKYKPRSLFLLILICLAVTSGISYFWKLDMCWNIILPFVPLLIGAIAGSVFLSLLAILIVKYNKLFTRVLQAIGKETFLILAFAEITIVYLNYFFSLNSVIKYALLVVVLYVLSLIKKYLLLAFSKN